MKDKTEPAIYTAKDIQDILRVGRPTVYKMLANGQLRSIRIGKNYRITQQSLEDFLRGGGE